MTGLGFQHIGRRAQQIHDPHWQYHIASKGALNRTNVSGWNGTVEAQAERSTQRPPLRMEGLAANLERLQPDALVARLRGSSGAAPKQLRSSMAKDRARVESLLPRQCPTTATATSTLTPIPTLAPTPTPTPAPSPNLSPTPTSTPTAAARSGRLIHLIVKSWNMHVHVHGARARASAFALCMLHAYAQWACVTLHSDAGLGCSENIETLRDGATPRVW